MNFWIDIEDSSGTKYGSGPIRSATFWRTPRRMDKAGEFSFEMPAADPKAAIVQNSRIAHCWAIVDGVVTDMGSGRIDSKVDSIRTDGTVMLIVSGSDLLRELTDRSVGFLNVYNETVGTSGTYRLTIGNSGGTYTNWVPTPPGGYAIASDQYLYVGYTDSKFDKVTFNLDTDFNGVVAYMSAEYWDGSTWTAVDVVEDGTAAGNVTMAQDGTIELDRKVNWATTEIEPTTGLTAYWVRFQPSADLDAISIAGVSVTTVEPSATAYSDILAFAPAGWSADVVNGQAETTDTIYARYAGETVLSALVKLAEKTGEHFRLSAGRTVAWLGPTLASSGVRAVLGLKGVVGEGTDHAILTDLKKTTETFDLVTRVYPYGSGNGGQRVNLLSCTQSAPSGYTLSTSGNYIENDTATAAYGLRERYVSYKDIATHNNRDNSTVMAANQLFDTSLTYLQRFSQPQESYYTALLNYPGTLYPGTTLRTVARKAAGGVVYLDIDADLYVLESTTEITTQGIRTVSAKLSTVDAWPKSDVDALIGTMEQGIVVESHPQAGPNNYVQSYYAPMDNNYPAKLAFWLGTEVGTVQQVLLRFQIDPLRSTTTGAASGGNSSPTSSSGGGATVTSASGGSESLTSASGGSDTVTSANFSYSTVTSGVASTPTTSSGGGQTVYTSTDDGSVGNHDHSVTVSDHVHTHYHNHDVTIGSHDHGVTLPGHTHGVSVPDHTHGVTIADHTHSVSVPGHTHALIYAISEESAANTLTLANLTYAINGAAITNVVNLGQGWYGLDVTANVRSASTLRPLQAQNLLQISTATAKTAHITGQLVVTTSIQSEQ